MILLKPKTSFIIPLLSIVLIIVAAYIFLFAENRDVLFSIQLHNFFNDTPEYFAECQRKPMGLLVWMGCWATQLFYEPWIGVALLTTIWCLTFIALKQGLRLSGYLAPLLLLPLIYLLGEDISIGYNLYHHQPDGYMFRDSIALMLGALILWAVSSVARLFIKPRLSIISKIPEKLRLPLGIVLLAAIGVGGWFYLSDKNFTDEAFHAECKVYRCVDEYRYDDALQVIGSLRADATRELVIMKNISLLNEGTIGEQMFHYDDFGVLPNCRDTTKIVPLVEISGPLIYLQHGMTNFARRWAMENSVHYGMNIALMKVMLQAALIDGEYDVAEKYINVLSHTLYYKEWAERFRPVIKNPKLLATFHEFKNIREIYRCRGNYVDTDGGKCESYIMNYFSKTRRIDSKLMQEVCLVYAIVTKDIQTFWPQFMVYATYHNEVPTHYQEVAYLYGQLEPQTMNVSRMPFDKEKIIDRYEAFNARAQQYMASGLKDESLAEAMRSEFGNTFWWAYFFNHGSKTY